ncbi:MAG: hypothetical protein JO306_07680 [Gemmatimonadetes bacterium]|nr:hypothetical protein [Gemmatimonadota bacterium]
MNAPRVATDDRDGDREFWLLVSMSSLDKIWNIPEDDVYAELLRDD